MTGDRSAGFLTNSSFSYICSPSVHRYLRDVDDRTLKYPGYCRAILTSLHTAGGCVSALPPLARHRGCGALVGRSWSGKLRHVADRSMSPPAVVVSPTAVAHHTRGEYHRWRHGKSGVGEGGGEREAKGAAGGGGGWGLAEFVSGGSDNSTSGDDKGIHQHHKKDVKKVSFNVAMVWERWVSRRRLPRVAQPVTPRPPHVAFVVLAPLIFTCV